MANPEESRKIAELVLGLAGSTYGELRKIETGITSQTGNLKATSDSIKKNIDDFVRGVRPNPALDPAANIPVPYIPGVTTTAPQVPLVPSSANPTPVMAPFKPEILVYKPEVVQGSGESEKGHPEENKGQLEFDFEKRARYDDLYNELLEIKGLVQQLITDVKSLHGQKKT